MEYRTACGNFPGIGCAWINAAGKTTAGYHGVADRESNTPMNRNTVFPECSISKFITAICVMKLHEQGAISINDPVNHYLQQWKLRSPDGNESNEVQVDEILSWASRFDDASYEAKHLVIAQLVDRIKIRKNDGYDINIHWRMTAEQFLGRKTEESA